MYHKNFKACKKFISQKNILQKEKSSNRLGKIILAWKSILWYSHFFNYIKDKMIQPMQPLDWNYLPWRWLYLLSTFWLWLKKRSLIWWLHKSDNFIIKQKMKWEYHNMHIFLMKNIFPSQWLLFYFSKICLTFLKFLLYNLHAVEILYQKWTNI